MIPAKLPGTPGDRHEIAERIVREATNDAKRMMSPGRWNYALGEVRLAVILGRVWPYMLAHCACATPADLRALMHAVDEHAHRAAGVSL